MDDRDKVALRSAGKKTIDPSVISIGGNVLVPLLLLSSPTAPVVVVVVVVVVVEAVVVSVYALPDLINNRIDAVGRALKCEVAVDTPIAVGDLMVTSSNSNSEHTDTGGLYHVVYIQHSKIALSTYTYCNIKYVHTDSYITIIVYNIILIQLLLTYIA